MAGENYRWTREHLSLERWDDSETLVAREPTNAEIMKLLDALHADMTGTNTPEYEQSLSDRHWSS